MLAVLERREGKLKAKLRGAARGVPVGGRGAAAGCSACPGPAPAPAPAPQGARGPALWQRGAPGPWCAVRQLPLGSLCVFLSVLPCRCCNILSNAVG